MSLLGFFRWWKPSKEKRIKEIPDNDWDEIITSDTNKSIKDSAEEKPEISKTADVLNYLKINGSITCKDAKALFNYDRLSAIIYKLKKKGIKIKSVRQNKIIKDIHRKGYVKTVSFVEYQLYK